MHNSDDLLMDYNFCFVLIKYGQYGDQSFYCFSTTRSDANFEAAAYRIIKQIKYKKFN